MRDTRVASPTTPMRLCWTVLDCALMRTIRNKWGTFIEILRSHLYPRACSASFALLAMPECSVCSVCPRLASTPDGPDGPIYHLVGFPLRPRLSPPPTGFLLISPQRCLACLCFSFACSCLLFPCERALPTAPAPAPSAVGVGVQLIGERD